MVPVPSARRTMTINDTTFVVKLEETRTMDTNETQQSEVVPTPVENVAPIRSMPTAEVDITPSYSQPKPPARLYFSPTLLHDDDENINEPIQPILSTIDQNQSSQFLVFLPKQISFHLIRSRKITTNFTSFRSNISH